MKQYFKIENPLSFKDIIMQYQEHDEAVEYVYPSDDLVTYIKKYFSNLKSEVERGLNDESAAEYFSDQETFEEGYLDSIQSALNDADSSIKDISTEAEYQDKQPKLENILNNLASVVFFVDAYEYYLLNNKGVKDNG